MRRLQNKMLLVMIMGILISSLVSGMIFTYATRNTINYDSQQILDLKAIHASSELSKKILMCENNNELMAGFITKTITTISNVTDYHYSVADIDNWNGLAWSMVEDTQDVSAIGFHFNPSFIHRKNAGFLISYSNTTGRMENLSSDYEDNLKPRTEDGFLSPYAQAVLAKKQSGLSLITIRLTASIRSRMQSRFILSISLLVLFSVNWILIVSPIIPIVFRFMNMAKRS